MLTSVVTSVLSIGCSVVKYSKLQVLFFRSCYTNETASTPSTAASVRRVDEHIPSPSYLYFRSGFDESVKLPVIQNMVIIEDFLSPGEEKSLFEEVEPYMKRLRYEFDHWDDAIHGYRETERSKWNTTNTLVVQRVREAAFPPGTPQLKLVHVLDLAEEGVIKAHVDSVRFCGNTIAGLSLLSDCVMRLIHTGKRENVVDVLLKRRSLYVMTNTVRYDFTHEVLDKSSSVFKNTLVPRGRRISIIFRNEPKKKQTTNVNEN